MTKNQFIELHSTLTVHINKTVEVNPLPSDTDPTQDIPVRNIECNALGLPINVKETKQVFSNLKIENFTTIEKRHQDQFDQLGELQDAVRKVSKSGISTNFVKPEKKQKNHEIEKDN